MARRSKRDPTMKKKKQIPFQVLERKTHPGIYKLMDDLIEEHHEHLADAKIVIAWRFGWKADSDGRIKLGQAKKAGELDRSLHGQDFVILLNHEHWNAAGFTDAHQRALIDHELCHCQVAVDHAGDPKTNEKGRVIYRVRHHDITEFRDVVARHGLYTSDLADFAKTCVDALKHPLFSNDAKKANAPDATAAAVKPPVPAAAGKPKVVRAGN